MHGIQCIKIVLQSYFVVNFLNKSLQEIARYDYIENLKKDKKVKKQ